MLGPERLFVPDEHATETLKLIDGMRSIGEIASLLAAQYDAPADIIEADITTLLEDLVGRGVLRL